MFFFNTDLAARRAAASVTPGAPACARIHRDCTAETLDALACTGIHQTCIPTTQDALACVSMTQDSIRADAKRHFFFLRQTKDKKLDKVARRPEDGAAWARSTELCQ